jgi:hypothetical protein
MLRNSGEFDMNQKSVLRAALAIGGLAGVVAISACSPNANSAGTGPALPVATSADTAPAAPIQQTTTPAKPAPATADKSIQPAPAHIYYPLCGDQKDSKSAIEPRSIVFSCDSTLELSDAHWTTWNSSYAQGTGRVAQNDCTPDCATGKSQVLDAKVRFDKPVKLSCGEFWSDVVFTYSNGKTEHYSPVPGTNTPQSTICG